MYIFSPIYSNTQKVQIKQIHRFKEADANNSSVPALHLAKGKALQNFQLIESDDHSSCEDDISKLIIKQGEASTVVQDKLSYQEPELFTVTSSGGQFVTSGSPEVKVTVPAHAIRSKLQVTIQVRDFLP